MRKLKIALIEDEPTILKIYEKILSKNYNVVTARDGKEGLKLIEKEKPVLALVDIRMPEMDGLKMVEELKKKNALNFPVIILTNLIDEKKIAQAIEMGVKDYILKEQAREEEILGKIQKALET